MIEQTNKQKNNEEKLNIFIETLRNIKRIENKTEQTNETTTCTNNEENKI